VRHLLAKGIALLSGRTWDDRQEFSSSLVLRTESIILDSGRPAVVRLEQIYAPKAELTGSLTAVATLHKLAAQNPASTLGEKVKDLAVLEGIGRDFMDEPLRIELDLAGIADGTFVARVELRLKDTPVGEAALALHLVSGLDGRLASLETELGKIRGLDDLKAEVRYPADRTRNVNRGRIDAGSFDVGKELVRAESTLKALKSGKNPFAGRTGDLERHYTLAGAGEIMPYRIYIPTKYNGKEPLPLIIALHGLGATQDSFFDGYGREFPRLAEQFGYIVAAPLGYRVDGGYGNSLLRSPEDPAEIRKAEYSEKDVMQVLEEMKKNYRIDDKRIYLAGHSMGAIGTWYLAAKYPDTWAAIAPFSGYGLPASVVKMKGLPAIVIHGDADPTVPVGGSRLMVEALKKLGVEHRYIEVPGGNHMNVVQPNFAAVFEFFNQHRK
jgi:predicted esterase